MALNRISPIGLPSASTTRIPHLLCTIASKRALHSFSPAPRPAKRTPQLKLLPPHLRVLQRRNYASQATTKIPPASSLPTRRLTLAEATGAAPSSSRSMNVYLWACCTFGFGLAVYISYAYFSYRNRLRLAQLDGLVEKLPFNADVSSRYDDLGRDYDDEVEQSERFMFMARKRGRVVGAAKGKVLEVSAGTGRNVRFYEWDGNLKGMGGKGIESVVFNDQSALQLRTLERKWVELQEGWAEDVRRGKRKVGEGFQGTVSFVAGDAGMRGVIQRPDGGFDTIVQTMGICSQRDPVGFLRMMGELVGQPDLEMQLRHQERKKRERKIGNKKREGDAEGGDDDGLGGQILLLEHGRSYYDWLNRFLDNGAVMHADHYGCWWNKDVGAIVQESGLKVEKIKRYHLGTTWEVVLRPNPNRVGGRNLKVEDEQQKIIEGSQKKDTKDSKGRSWW